MRAALIKAFGEPTKVLELPTCRNLRDRLRVRFGRCRVRADHMNDLYVIQGAFPVRPSLPSVVGNEGVGRVLGGWSGVEHLKVGDQVLIPLYAFSWRERLSYCGSLFTSPG